MYYFFASWLISTYGGMNPEQINKMVDPNFLVRRRIVISATPSNIITVLLEQ